MAITVITHSGYFLVNQKPADKKEPIREPANQSCHIMISGGMVRQGINFDKMDVDKLRTMVDSVKPAE